MCSSLSTSQEITIVIDKAPTAIINLSLPLAVCAGETFTATAINPDGNTLVWTEINGNHGTFVNGTLDTATFNQSLNNNSNFEIQLTSNTTTACASKVVPHGDFALAVIFNTTTPALICVIVGVKVGFKAVLSLKPRLLLVPSIVHKTLS